MRIVAVLLFVAFLSTSTVYAFPVDSILQREQENTTLTSSQDLECAEIDGDQDMYGLGIRLAVYLQSAAGFIGGRYLQKSVQDIKNTTFLFQFAMLIGLIYTTIRKKDLYAVEALVMVLFTLCSPSGGIDFIGKLSKAPRHLHTQERVIAAIPIIRTATWAGVVYYQVWFWYIGLNKLVHTPCTTNSFFFARVNIYGPFRIWARIWTTYTATSAGGLVLAQILIWIYKAEKKIEKTVADAEKESAENPGPDLVQQATESPEIESDPVTEKNPPTTTTSIRVEEPVAKGDESDTAKGIDSDHWIFRFNRQMYGFTKRTWGVDIMNLFFLGMTITATELTIKWNNIRGVYSLATVGQLIPLIIAASGVIGMIVHWEKLPSEEPTEQEHNENISKEGNPSDTIANEKEHVK